MFAGKSRFDLAVDLLEEHLGDHARKFGSDHDPVGTAAVDILQDPVDFPEKDRTVPILSVDDVVFNDPCVNMGVNAVETGFIVDFPVIFILKITLLP